MPKDDATETKKRKKMALGRGLDALLPDIQDYDTSPRTFFYCDVQRIQPNRYQPRRRFDETELNELAESIKAQGIIQPLVVHQTAHGYELIAGERRLRAARLAGVEQVPVVLKEVQESDLLEMSLVENIQRENLNPIEEAEAYHRMMVDFGRTQEEVAEKVGKSRSAVANFLRLRQLPKPVVESVADGRLSMGHARALLSAGSTGQQLAAWRKVLAQGLSVRETERLVKRLKTEQPVPPPGASSDIYFRDLAEDLSRRFGTKVQIQRRGKKGRVAIEFYSDADLERVLSMLKPV